MEPYSDRSYLRENFWKIKGILLYAVVVCATILCSIFLFHYYSSFTNPDTLAYNAYAKTFNALPESEREAMTPFLKYDLPIGEKVLPLKQVHHSRNQKPLTDFHVVVLFVFFIILASLLFYIFFSAGETFGYISDLIEDLLP
ncbi:hypothetical protein FWF89_03520 [Candidatus Saccharibacteria bacterium]|nr:hypothetical protein [Candidatus Saccharibacteria bacterium]